MASGQDWPGRNGVNLQLNDQRLRPVQPRRELTQPVQENQTYLGQASLDFQSIQETDGASTIHQDVADIQRLNIGGSCLPSTNSRNPTNFATDHQTAFGHATRPHGSVPVYADDLPMLSNGGRSLIPSMPPVSVVVQPERNPEQRKNGYPGDELVTNSSQYLGVERERKGSDSDVSMESEDRQSPAKFFDMNNKQDREDSFKNGPDVFQLIQKLAPNLLAEDGFYYTGCADQVQCFYCGTLICYWEPTDDILIEHIKHGPPDICEHLKGTKDMELLLTIQASLAADGAAPSAEPMASDQMLNSTGVKEPQNMLPNNSMNSYMSGSTTGEYATASQGLPKPFQCWDCKTNPVNHTQLKCGHGICHSCIISLEPVPMEERKCSVCSHPVIGYAPYSPGCLKE